MQTVKQSTFASDPSSYLRAAKEHGEVVIESDDGAQYSLRLKRSATAATASPLDVGYVKGLRLDGDEIVDLIRAGRERD